MTVLCTIITQLMFQMMPEGFSCDTEYEIEGGCDSNLRNVSTYISLMGMTLLAFLVFYADIFITRWFPDNDIPWAAWCEKSRLLRNIYKAVEVIS